jgi:hypothetical protein
MWWHSEKSALTMDNVQLLFSSKYGIWKFPSRFTRWQAHIQCFYYNIIPTPHLGSPSPAYILTHTSHLGDSGMKNRPGIRIVHGSIPNKKEN